MNPLKRVISRFFEDLEARRCPYCGKRIERAEQEGKCVYFRPCGHHMGRGLADDLNRVWAEEEA